MPYKDLYGKTIGIVGRTILSDEVRKTREIPKYRNTIFDKGKNLFGMYLAKNEIVRKDCVFVCEGQLDCAKAYERGFYNVIALGSSNLTFDQLALILRYTKNIVLLLDNDEAGIIGMDKAEKQFGSFASIKRGKLPSGYKDLYELAEMDGLDGLEIMM